VTSTIEMLIDLNHEEERSWEVNSMPRQLVGLNGDRHLRPFVDLVWLEFGALASDGHCLKHNMDQIAWKRLFFDENFRASILQEFLSLTH